KNDKEVALACVLQLVRHMQVGIHAGLQYRYTTEFVEFSSVGLVVEGTGNEHIELRISGLAGGSDEVSALNSAEFRADKDPSALFEVPLHISAHCANQVSWPGYE